MYDVYFINEIRTGTVYRYFIWVITNFLWGYMKELDMIEPERVISFSYSQEISHFLLANYRIKIFVGIINKVLKYNMKILKKN